MTKQNKLIHETSPYLQQHANNPVAWYAWGEEALNKAKQENKPILLSIGYAACHWCHVMAHESFEDEATAEIMNRDFINIKVDREERPDIDRIYQTAYQLLTQRGGGWPLTAFLSPNDLAPFFIGTYFPLEARYQLPSFKEILQKIESIYRLHGDEIKKQNQSLLEILQRTSLSNSASAVLDDQPLQLAHAALMENYDHLNGGFGNAPKFPHPPMLDYLLHEKNEIVIDALRRMAEGGIYDQLRGGFYRYTVDAKWQIPHFEKMLYDNAQLLFLYASAARVYQEAFFADIARETGLWVTAEMQARQGGYFSSLDADSEGHEGKFYVWDTIEIKAALTEEEFSVANHFYGLDQTPNFEGQRHLSIQGALITLDEEKLLASAKIKLLALREKRPRPFRDEKILTSWNALMMKGMLVASDTLKEPSFAISAQASLDFIKKNLWIEKHLLATSKDGKSHLPAYLDDYVFLIDALLTSLNMMWHTPNLLFAIELADSLLKRFYDEKNGGFFFTATDHEELLYRPKTFMDEAIPSGNGIAVQVLIRLGYLLGETRYLAAAEKTLSAAWPILNNYPSEHCSLLRGLKNYLKPEQSLILRGEKGVLLQWMASIKQEISFSENIYAIPDDVGDLPEALAIKKSSGQPCAYLCVGSQCLSVIEDLETLLSMLKTSS